MMLLLIAVFLARLSSAFTAIGGNNFQEKYPYVRKTLLGDSSTVRRSVNRKEADISFNVKLNDFFRDPLPEQVTEKVAVSSTAASDANNVVSTILSPPGSPGVPRPLSTVIVASIPTGLVWYGYYKFCIEEELFDIEVKAGKEPKGYGGYGTLGPFTYGLMLGPLAEILNLPGGLNWSGVGIAFIYYTQFLLYERVNSLYEEEGLEPPLTVWWCWPIFFPFNLIVGLRQVHFLSEYFYLKQGNQPTIDPVSEFFPFISSKNFTWQDFVKKPSLWCSLLKDKEDIAEEDLPMFLQKLMHFSLKD